MSEINLGIGLEQLLELFKKGEKTIFHLHSCASNRGSFLGVEGREMKSAKFLNQTII